MQRPFYGSRLGPFKIPQQKKKKSQNRTNKKNSEKSFVKFAAFRSERGLKTNVARVAVLCCGLVCEQRFNFRAAPFRFKRRIMEAAKRQSVRFIECRGVFADRAKYLYNSPSDYIVIGATNVKLVSERASPEH